mgnify:CR=1 FL=1
MNNKKGFTLIEIIIALSILVIIVPAFTGAILSALDNEEDMNRRLEANRISSSIAETLKTDDYKANLAPTSEDPDISWNEDKDLFNSYNINFFHNKTSDTEITIEISNTNSPSLYNIKINWENINYNLETLIAGED